MLHRLALGLSLLATAACSQDRPGPCVEDQAYCDGNVAHACKLGAGNAPLDEWEERTCQAGQTCVKGSCLNEPLVACSTPHDFACSDDGKRIGLCESVGYWNWVHTCETAIGEACYLTGLSQSPDCILPSLGACSPESTEMCFQDRVLICTRGFWQQAWYACDTSQGEACVVGRTIEHQDFVSCILPGMGVCSATDPPACLGNTIVECQPVGRWAKTQDCARFEQVCLNGQCVSSSVLPQRP